MAEKPVAKEVQPEVLPARINIKEFLFMVEGLTNVQKAGFISYAKGKSWMRPQQWKDLLNEYRLR
jgi:hypothetical protein